MMNATMHELHSARTVLMIIANLRQALPPRKIKTINENRKILLSGGGR